MKECISLVGFLRFGFILVGQFKFLCFKKHQKSPVKPFVLSTFCFSFLRGKDLHRGFLSWL